ncbi:MAG: recombination regulator RecX [Clostridiales bacterium]|nr:recombination regulator RecX [Clostridiales bacterium]
MKITAKRGKVNKIHVYVDGEFLMTVDEEFWYTCGHAANEDIDDGELVAFKEAASRRCAFNKALDLISRREHGKEELKRKLRRSFDDDAAESAVNRLEELGMVDDNRFAERLAEELFERKGMSPRAIRFELLARGISNEITNNITQALDNEPVSRIIDLLETKYGGWQKDEKTRAKTYNTLVRLGYNYSDIRSAMSEFNIEIPE